MKKFINEMSHEEWKKAIVQMAMDMEDLTVFTDGTLKKMYNELYSLEDITEDANYYNILTWFEQEEIEPLSMGEMKKLIKILNKTEDANNSLWENIQYAYQGYIGAKKL